MKSALKVFKALSDETRLRLVTLLAQGEMCVCDLTAALGLPQSTVSRHLTHLKNADLVKDRKKGVWTYYRLAGPGESPYADLISLLPGRLAGAASAQGDLHAYREFKAGKDRPC